MKGEVEEGEVEEEEGEVGEDGVRRPKPLRDESPESSLDPENSRQSSRSSGIHRYLYLLIDLKAFQLKIVYK